MEGSATKTEPEPAAPASRELEESALGLERVRDYQSIEREPAPQNTSDAASLLPCRRCYRQKGTLWEHILYFCALSVASYAGVFARIYLFFLARWDGVPLFTSLYAQAAGSLIMGFITSHKQALEGKHKPVYQGIATGLCGSITTFSSWNSEAVTVLLQVGATPPNNVVRIIGWGTTLFLGFCVPVVALQVGRHLARLSPWSDARRRVSEEGVASRLGNNDIKRTYCETIEDFLIVITWIVSTALVIALPWRFKRFDLLFSAVFAAAGTYIRWHLSPLNAAITHFKLGTFLANVSGSWILAAVLTLHIHLGSTNSLADEVLVGIATGFCGCLTTVSTFVVELGALSLVASYCYGGSSVLAAHLGLVAVRGGYLWSTG